MCDLNERLGNARLVVNAHAVKVVEALNKPTNHVFKALNPKASQCAFFLTVD